ncbi:MAG: DUF5362 family protein [Bacteroidota bacterium]
MENQIYQDEQNEMNTEMTLTQTSISYLRGTIPWLKFISILVFIIWGITLIVAFKAIDNNVSGIISEERIIQNLILFLSALVYIVSNTYLFNYSRKLRDALNSSDIKILENAFLMQKKYWKFTGILVIVFFSLTLLLFLSSFIFY